MPVGREELACIYSALILADDNVEITTDKIETLLQSAKVSVKPYWPALFARVLANRSIDELILSAGAGAPVAAAGSAPAGAASAAAETAVEAKKEPEPAEESDDDMGFGLFD